MFTVGQWMRKRYIEDNKFLSPTFDQSEMYVRSTEMFRTVQTAQSLLQGLYPPGTGPKLTPPQAGGEGWLPPLDVGGEVVDRVKGMVTDETLAGGVTQIPIFTAPYHEDSLLLGYECAALGKKYWGGMKQHQEKYRAEFAPHVEFAAKHFGMEPTLENFRMIGDIMQCEKQDGRPLPEGITQEFHNAAMKVVDLSLDLGFGDKQLAKQGSTMVFYNALRDMMEKRAKGEPINLHKIGLHSSPYVEPYSMNVKFVYLSAHDTTLATFLGFLDYQDGKQTPFASTVIFELWEEADGTHTVNVLYNGKNIPLPDCPSGERCNLDKFIEFIKVNTPTRSYKEICSETEEGKKEGEEKKEEEGVKPKGVRGVKEINA
eukprot:GDKI01015226.1.p1 GENE.GDKI01015226.1~~GDKI01015226.1.p1  ORF type:complete len:372 (-),score=128.47 GDKI01015226.1:192-1307(-)